MLALVTVLALTAQSSAALAAGIQAQIMEIQTQQSVERLQANRAIYTQATEFEGIQKSAGNSYAMEVSLPGEEKTGYQPVVRMDIDLTDTDQIAAILAMDSMPQIIKEELAQRSACVAGLSESSHTLVLFAPAAFIDASDLDDDKVLPPMSELPVGEETDYYTYNGHRMASVRAFVDDETTDERIISEGKASVEFASEFADVIINGVLGNGAFGIASNFYSILQMFLDIAGIANTDIFDVSSEDRISLEIRFNRISQFTFMESGTQWMHCLTTKQIYVTKAVCTQKYYVSISPGHSELKEVSTVSFPQKTYTTAYFNDPWSTAAFFVGNPLIMFITIEAGDLSYRI